MKHLLKTNYILGFNTLFALYTKLYHTILIHSNFDQ